MRIEMLDAAYLRRQAELYFAMAELMSDPVDAQFARSAAEQYVQRAKNAEQQEVATRSSRSADQERKSISKRPSTAFK
jgi:hypothetical protein